jgi:chromosome segregation ATPase
MATLEDEIKETRDQVKATEDRLAEQTRQRDTTRLRIAELERWQNEIERAATAYRQAHPTMVGETQEAIADVEAYALELKGELTEERRVEIEAEIGRVEAEIKKAADAAAKALKRKGEGLKAVEAAQQERDAAESAFNAIRDQAAGAQASLRDVRDLRTQLARGHERKEFAMVYFYLREIKAALESDPLKALRSPDALREELSKSWEALDKSQRALAARKAAFEEQSLAAEVSEKEASAVRQQRRACILKLLARA